MDVLATVRVVIYDEDRTESPLNGVDLDWVVERIADDDALRVAVAAIQSELAMRGTPK